MTEQGRQAAEGRIIDIGVPGAWSWQGLKALDDAVSAFVRAKVTTRRARRALRWYLLDSLTSDPVVRPFRSLEAVLKETRPRFWLLYLDQLQEGRGQLDERLTGHVIGWETDLPVRTKHWKTLREVVFQRIGLRFGPAPAKELLQAKEFDVGEPGRWRYDVIRAFDTRLVTLAYHHAKTEFGAETIRWHVWDQVTRAPRVMRLDAIQEQLEAAETSLIAEYSVEARRARGHLDDREIAYMIGFSNVRPVVDGFFRQLREDTYCRLAGGFGAMECAETTASEGAFVLGRQGEWNADTIADFDRVLLDLTRRYAKSEAGAQALRWYFLDEVTSDADIPADPMLVEQQLKMRAAGPREIFLAFLKKRSVLADSRIARFVGYPEAEDITAGQWRDIRARVLDRVGEEAFAAAG